VPALVGHQLLLLEDHAVDEVLDQPLERLDGAARLAAELEDLRAVLGPPLEQAEAAPERRERVAEIVRRQLGEELPRPVQLEQLLGARPQRDRLLGCCASVAACTRSSESVRARDRPTLACPAMTSSSTRSSSVKTVRSTCEST
jgi:hypothetical protein